MKIFAVINLLAVVYVAAGMDPGSVMNAVQASVGKVSHIAHRHVEKRQASSDFTYEDFIRCSSAVVEHQCSSGYAQETINIALGCGNTTAARETSVTCTRNEVGQSCGAAVLDFCVNDNQTQNAETCSRATSGSCPSTCRMFLQFARSELGCCFNTLINTTDSPYYRYSEYAAYPVWNWCNIDLPPAACGNTLPLNPPSNVQTCTFSEYFNRTVNYECMASVGQPLVDVLLQTSRCYPYARRLVDACGTNANGEFCAQLIGQNLLATISANRLLESLIECGQPDESICTSDSYCRSVVINVRNTFGCCVNVYNNSVIWRQPPSLAYGYWNLCGVETPGFCTSTLSSATAMRAIAWLIVAAMTLVYVVPKYV